VLREVLETRALGDAINDSVLEARFARLCQLWGLPAPLAQFAVLSAGRWRRIDFAYPDLKIAIEVDGFGPHSGRKAFEDDRARANELEIMGWLILRFTWNQVTKKESWVAAKVREAIALRRCTMGDIGTRSDR
jgi:hypothetical protein